MPGLFYPLVCRLDQLLTDWLTRGNCAFLRECDFENETKPVEQTSGHFRSECRGAEHRSTLGATGLGTGTPEVAYRDCTSIVTIPFIRCIGTWFFIVAGFY